MPRGGEKATAERVPPRRRAARGHKTPSQVRAAPVGNTALLLSQASPRALRAERKALLPARDTTRMAETAANVPKAPAQDGARAPAKPGKTSSGGSGAEQGAQKSEKRPNGKASVGKGKGLSDTQLPASGEGGGPDRGGSGGGDPGGGDQKTGNAGPGTTSSSPAVQALGNALPSGASQALVQARAAGDQEVASERAKLQGDPPQMDGPTGLGATPAGAAKAGEGDKGGAPAGASIAEQKGEGAPQEKLDPAHDVAETPAPEAPSLSGVDRGAEDDPMAMVQRYQNLLAAMPVSDEINTDPGPPKPVALTGEADPCRIDDQVEKDALTFALQQSKAQSGMQEDEGIEDIYPTLPDERLTGMVAPPGGAIPNVESGEVPQLRPEVQAGMDRGLGPTWASEVDGASGDHATALNEKQSSEVRERAATDQRIAEIESGTKAEQLAMRETAHGEVATARTDWQADIDTARGTYDDKRVQVDTNLTRDVDAEVLDAESKAQGHLDDGRNKAEREQRRVESLAAQKRREAENKRKEADGFLDWLASKVKSFLAKLKQALLDMFDALRTFVTKAIAAAKKLADAAIELGRKAVIGIIRTAGAAMELAADVFLAAFPEARDRAKAAIRKGREKCEKAVNAAAAALRKAVHAALDLLAKGLLFIIDVYEKFYIGLINVFEAVALGFIEVTRALNRLDIAAHHSPFELEGQIYDQMFGADLTEPLPFELTSSEMSQRDAVSKAPSSAAANGMATIPASPATGGEPLSIGLDPVLPFSPKPELLAGHNFDSGPVEFAGNTSGDGSLEALMGSAAPEEAAGVEGAEAMEGGDLDPAAAQVPQDDFSAMSDEEKFEYYKNIDGPKECRTDTPTKQEGEPIPLDRKIGPLTRSQRFSYMMPKAWEGIKHWTKCNWGKILLGILAVIAVIAASVAISILTGGTAAAGLLALLTVFTGAMVLVAIGQVALFLGDYLNKSVKGDVVGGGKALAGAFAVAAVEVIFAILTYVTGGIFRAIAASVKGAGRVASGAIKVAAKAAGRARGVAGGVKRALPGVTRVGKGAVKVGGAFFRRGKLMVKNVRSGFERGAKSLRELGERLRKKLPFRRYRIIRRGRYYWLQAQVNPWVDVARSGLVEIDANDVPAGTKIGDEFTLPDGRRGKLVGDSDMGRPMKQMDELDEVAIKNMDELDSVKGSGGKTGKNEATWHQKADGELHGVDGRLNEMGKGKKRSSAETTEQGKVGKSGNPGDEGGHAVGYRFMDEQGAKNLFAQAGNFNKSAWKKMENEWAAFVKRGYKVDFKIKLKKHKGGRPDEISVVYDVTSPHTNKVMRRGPFTFNNVAGETFERIPSKRMKW